MNRPKAFDPRMEGRNRRRVEWRGQALLRRPGGPIYRCFLPDLAGFISSSRTGPDLSTQRVLKFATLYFVHRYSLFGVSLFISRLTNNVFQTWRREGDLNPRGSF